ncbi:GPW/gp25 family protein [Nocardia goodfellowii]|uniref:Phage baseplate assembly protein W n=1 Tax=Nocardia goodfellowii TaxID=882446 RepID=A0ABS4QMM9_9NOCA|nr:GPW/gp25 family protein [Nocardia goodfellowii]MBP2192963.1 phage baseplate assembly protein W [Nocardia goodfellowii]
MTEPRGPSIPFRIDPGTGSAAWSTGTEKIREDLMLLLGTRLGERPMLREFGSNVAALAHEPDDDVTADLLRRQAEEAVICWETRVVVTSAQVRRHGDTVELALRYLHADAPASGLAIIPLA